MTEQQTGGRCCEIAFYSQPHDALGALFRYKAEPATDPFDVGIMEIVQYLSLQQAQHAGKRTASQA